MAKAQVPPQPSASSHPVCEYQTPSSQAQLPDKGLCSCVLAVSSVGSGLTAMVEFWDLSRQVGAPVQCHSHFLMLPLPPPLLAPAKGPDPQKEAGCSFLLSRRGLMSACEAAAVWRPPSCSESPVLLPTGWLLSDESAQAPLLVGVPQTGIRRAARKTCVSV